MVIDELLIAIFNCYWAASLCKHSAISYQLSAISYQLSAISYQLSAFSFQLSAFSDQLMGYHSVVRTAWPKAKACATQMVLLNKIS
ncbi:MULTISPECIES: hypothetical protein [unclassified Moorena]|uniref:hypothetical protein n=1 Tax=unclassified Moorena TaxID=2683338 RepID=UPI0014017D96|nr:MULTISPECIES: hypothetical protein [unclassified Moorena]NEO14048.1 hypothetical protein [Moorena sp. SIO3E8]NEQ00523.1 hypothetical protein [Moorena sp. SIO3F7]